MERSVLASVLVIGMAATMLGAGTMAYFRDTETVGVHDIQAGTLDLTVNNQNPCTVHITIDKVKPGDTITRGWYWLRNIGNLPGILSVEISPIKNYENGRTEPEIAAGDNYGELNGELGAKLIVTSMAINAKKKTNTTVLPNPLGNNLNWVGGKTFVDVEGDTTMLPGTEYYFRWTLELPEETGNIVQSDSVEFDIIFHLEQVP